MSTKGLDIAAAESNWGFKGRNYLLAIGIDAYTAWPPLSCAVKDVEDFIAVLTLRYQFEPADVTLIKNDDATEKNVLAGIRQMVQKVGPEDNLIIYYSGHGHYEETTRTGYWIPVDAPLGTENEYQFIDTAIIVDRIRAINSLHTLLIVDACFSGTLVSKIKASPRSERYKSRRVFTSGRVEVVMDGPKGGNSPFAKGVLNYLTKNTDKFLPASRLILDVSEYVEKEVQQTPTDSRLMNAGDEGGDFVFHLKMSEAEIWADTVQQHNKDAYARFLVQFPESEHRHEAQEAADWLAALADGAMQSLKVYLNKYQPKGKYVPLAISQLSVIEEEHCWNDTKKKHTLSAYFEYLYRYPEGKYAEEARLQTNRMDEGTEDRPAYDPNKDKSASLAYIRKVDPPTAEQAWETSQKTGTYLAYLNFKQAYPDSAFVGEAEKEMQRLDNIALNKIRIMEQDKSLSIPEKIDRCLDYFNTFPGAANNRLVKQLKDRLELQKYRKDQ